MHVAFKRDEPIKAKKITRKQQVEEMARVLRAKWEANDRTAAIIKYNLQTSINH